MTQKPENEFEMIHQLWFAVVGSNGDGIATLVKKNSKQIEHILEILPTLQTKDECIYVQRRREETDTDFEQARKIRRNGWALTLVGAGATVAAGILAIL